MVSRANVAAQLMEHLCTCPEHGYSQPGRYGTSGYCSVQTDAGVIKVKRGDRDCTSACGDAWELALEGTPYAGKISRTTWTGNMVDMFVGSGLFEVKPMSFDAQRGDVYHVHNSSRQHAAMCMQNDSKADLLGEFSIAETGGIDGEPGDQTGSESSVHAFYDGFERILHYNGKADSTEAKASTAKKCLNGIDIASHQEGIDVTKVDADFVIVKVSGGTSYVNDRAHGAWRDWRDIANAVLKAGKLLGLYHYACEYGSEPGGKAEAEFFLKQIKGFEGKAVLCLDWEAHAQSMPVSYAREWLDAVAKATGSTPMFYGYASYLNSRDHSSIKKYPLWMASYLYRYDGGIGYVDNPENTWDTGSWPEMTMYQYSSTRKIGGYSES